MTTNTNTTSGPIVWSDENITELIRKLRNDLVKDFLDERYLMAYFAEQYNWKEITRVKVEFIKKDLKELLLSPVDLTHYAELKEHIKEFGAASIADKHESLFYQELEKIFRKYF